MSLSCLVVNDFSNAFSISFLVPIQSDAADVAEPGMCLKVEGKMLTQHMFNMCHKEETIPNRQ